MILRGRGRSAVADAPFRPRESQVRTRAQVIGRRGPAPADRRGQQVRVRASSARPTPGDGDAGGDQADGRAPARARRRPPRRVRVRPAAPLDPDRRQRLGTPGRRSTSKRRDCRSGVADAPSATVTADTPPSASPRSAVPAGTTSAPAGGTTGETRCPSQALRL